MHPFQMRPNIFQKILILLLFTLGASSSTTAGAQSLVNIPDGPNNPGTCGTSSSAGCEDKAVFNTSSFDTWYGRWVYFSAQNSRIMYNVKYDSNSDGVLDAWRFNPSKVAVEMSPVDPGSTAALGWVHASSTRDFYNPADGKSYRRVMYFIFQETPAPGVPAGRVCLSFSNATSSINDWTPPIAAIFSTTSSSLRGRPCNATTGEVLAEAISGFRETSSRMGLFGLNGDLAILDAAVGTNLTETYYLTTTPATPDVITTQAMITSNGMVTPTTPGGDNDYFFRNLDATYDATSGRVYLLRVTPYPFDKDSPDTPCAPGGTFVCEDGLATFPLRGQVYMMQVGTNIGQTTSSSRSWSLVEDLGSDEGWGVESGGVCTNYGLVDFRQTDYGIDVDSLTIHKQPSGRLANLSGNMLLFMGGWIMPDRKTSCSTAATIGGTWRDAELYEMPLPIP